MKKVLFFVALATFTTGTMVSCGKSSKGKMDAEWTIDSMDDKSTYTGTNGTTSSTTTAISGTTITITDVNGGNTDVTTGVVNEAKWTIKKDGTWERTITTTFTDEIAGTDYIVNTVTSETGNWDFLAGVGEFKKNERVVFNKLTSKTTTKTTVGSNESTQTDNDTYLDGEVSEVYVITESKSKSLSLEYTGSNSSTSTQGSSSSTTKNTEDRKVVLSAN